jgi:hypothetical protein
MFVALILATIVDLALAALLVAVSGFIFGGGPEGMNGELTAAAIWWTGFVGCLAAPIAGFVLRARKLGGWGVAVAFIRPAVGLCFLGL